MIMDKIKTVGKAASAEIVEKKSVFIGYAAPVSSESEARDFVASIKKKHADARHNVSAYVLSGGIMHSSDDGEPSGTAGVPVLEVIKKSGVANTAVVVTRYFGGILLGAGGLARAYSAAAKAAIDAAGVVTYEKFDECRIVCAYGDYSDVLYRLGSFTVKMGEATFGADVCVAFAVLADERGRLDDEIAARFDGRYFVETTGERYDVR